MKITELFALSPRTYSFEFFPPKDEISAVDFGINIGKLLKLSPSFVTVTYGAGGSTRERTFDLVNFLQNKVGLTTMAHYTCVSATQDSAQRDLQVLRESGIENLMVLRGDPPAGTTQFVTPHNGFKYASEMMTFIRQQGFDFCMGGGAYPEKHPEAASPEADIEHLKLKIAVGAQFLMTQLFFINDVYFRFVEKCRAAGITCRIIPGIIPITNLGQLERFTRISRSSIPPEFVEKMQSYAGQPDKLYQTGMDYSIQQCRDLLLLGAPGLHFYTLNKSRATIEIFETLYK